MLADDSIIKALIKAIQPLLNDIVKEQVENNIKTYQLKLDDEDDMSLTRKDVMRILQISYQCVHNYTHDGLLNYKIRGNKYTYSKTQIKEFTTEKPKRKNRKTKT